jgi:hypothetical protein
VADKRYFLTVLAVVLGGLVLYLNRDWFARRPIQISHRYHAFGGRFSEGAVAPLLFEFNRALKLTTVKVVCVEGTQTNKVARPVWQLTTDSNSVPTRGFVYGMSVPGMRPALAGVVADPLEPGYRYRLHIEAGSAKADHDFSLDSQ